jgi:hypothetical protein
MPSAQIRVTEKLGPDVSTDPESPARSTEVLAAGAAQRSLLFQLLAAEFLCRVVFLRNFVFPATQASIAIVAPNGPRTELPYLPAMAVFTGRDTGGAIRPNY